MTPIDIESLRKWIGRRETSSERMHPAAATLLAASLDAEDPQMSEGMELPPLFHWLYFLPVCRQSQLGTDGHPFLLCGQPRAEAADIRLWTCDASRSMCTEAFAIIA